MPGIDSAFALFVAICCLSVPARAWSFTAAPTGQCGPVTLNWSGGTAPFTVQLHATDHGGHSFKVDPSNFQNGQGSMQLTLPFAAGTQYVITMGDATGPLSGGATNVLTAGPAPSGANTCSTTFPSNDFYWTSPANNPTSCGSYAFTEIQAAPNGGALTFPATLYVILPGGTGSFTVPVTSATLDWKANIASGTQVLFDMVDSQGHQGGADTALRTVGSGGSSCSTVSLTPVNQTPPTSSGVSSKTSSTGSATASNAASTASPSSTPSHGLSSGAIAGVAVGAAAVILGCLAFVIALMRRRKHNNRRDSEGVSFGPSTAPSFAPPSSARTTAYDPNYQEPSVSSVYGGVPPMQQHTYGNNRPLIFGNAAPDSRGDYSNVPYDPYAQHSPPQGYGSPYGNAPQQSYGNVPAHSSMPTTQPDLPPSYTRDSQAGSSSGGTQQWTVDSKGSTGLSYRQ